MKSRRVVQPRRPISSTAQYLHIGYVIDVPAMRRDQRWLKNAIDRGWAPTERGNTARRLAMISRFLDVSRVVLQTLGQPAWQQHWNQINDLLPKAQERLRIKPVEVAEWQLEVRRYSGGYVHREQLPDGIEAIEKSCGHVWTRDGQDPGQLVCVNCDPADPARMLLSVTGGAV